MTNTQEVYKLRLCIRQIIVNDDLEQYFIVNDKYWNWNRNIPHFILFEYREWTTVQGELLISIDNILKLDYHRLRFSSYEHETYVERDWN